MPDHYYGANLIWQIADLLRGPYRPPQYKRVMLPVSIDRAGFNRERVIFPQTVLAFIRETQPKEYARLDALAAATERSLALLKERRTALIAAAVTGQVRIPEVAQ